MTQLHRRLALLVCCALSASAWAQDAPVPTLPEVRVIRQAPLPGFGIPRTLYPGNAQEADEAERRDSGATNLPEFMNQRLQGVIANEVQGSPFQVDILYRGQRLSPLLGTPQGLSLYLDGVRMNQPFGDVVSWDLLPEAAIADLVLVPGSNPLYGLNTLAGALVLSTKSGLTHPGGEAEFSFGSGQRKRLDVAQGWRNAEGSHLFAAATLFDEEGWRDRSPGKLGNVFLKYGRRQADTDWNVSLLVAGSNLTGNGLLNESLAAVDWRAVYTAPDRTRSRDALLTFQGTHALDPQTTLSLQAWLRGSRRDGINGDIEDDDDDDGEDDDDDDEVGGPPPAVFNRSRSRQEEAGLGLQWNRSFGMHELTLGAELAANRVRHDQFSQEAVFDARRNTLPVAGAEDVHEVALRGRSRRYALFAADIVKLSPRLQLTPSLRWNVVHVSNTLGHPDEAADESFRYRKLNPALGASYTVRDGLVLFGNAAQGNRVPTSLELGCADPEQPCVLPTGLQADPFLKQVVSRTYEAGVRGRAGANVEWSAAVFRTDNRDDILFVRSGVSQEGFFTNIDRTRRQGLELAAQGRYRQWDWLASYTHVDATFQSSGVLPGPLSTEDTPNTFRSGTRMAGVPRNVVKLAVGWRVLPQLRLGLDLLAASGQVVAGNESGTRPELGRVAGYGVLNARANWQFARGWEAWLRVNNVTDKRFASAAVGNLDFFPAGRPLAPGEEAQAARFIGPAAPRTAFVGVRYVWE
ncbi:MAG TPA: TonB-dependent receptor [Ramlibacter sp.]|uniref:TonB-dependent receptor n=1 Tax=Ramlibacter sp. TaxID=1917967 RepID=UPI002D7F454A|nr:TonB-dependent receptor [Ramlibacter sp.]HET8745328.1 TonB-dependent receptor [Ramlibacter sp.]